ncbi:unnamed protein product [Rotaria socialis]|nr:unnamed protein product [Rotaria socialis]
MIHYHAAQQVLKYAYDIAFSGIHMFANNPETYDNITIYTEADFAADQDGRKSTAGYVIIWGNTILSWKSKRLYRVSQCTMEAEYQTATEELRQGKAAQLMLHDDNLEYVKCILESSNNCKLEIFKNQKTDINILCDNQATIEICTNQKYYERTKHWSIDFYWLREQIQNGLVYIQYKPSKEMLAYMLTKNISHDILKKHSVSLGIGIP